MTLNELWMLPSYWKDKHLWRHDRGYLALCCSILIVNKSAASVKNLAKEFTLDVDSGYKDAAYIQMTCCTFVFLTLSWWRPLSYRNQFIDLRSKSMDWFLYDNDLRDERVKVNVTRAMMTQEHVILWYLYWWLWLYWVY